LEEAITTYQKALSLNPDYAEPYHGLGVVLRDQGELEEAIAAYQKARDLYRSQGKTQKENESLNLWRS
jgi:superkiller protein 3